MYITHWYIYTRSLTGWIPSAVYHNHRILTWFLYRQIRLLLKFLSTTYGQLVILMKYQTWPFSLHKSFFICVTFMFHLPFLLHMQIIDTCLFLLLDRRDTFFRLHLSHFSITNSVRECYDSKYNNKMHQVIRCSTIPTDRLTYIGWPTRI